MSNEKNVPPQRGSAADPDDLPIEAKYLDFFPLDSLNQPIATPFTAYALNGFNLEGPVYRSVGATLTGEEEVSAAQSAKSFGFERDVLNDEVSFPYTGLINDIPLVPAYLDVWHSFTTPELPARVIERLKEAYDDDSTVDLVDSDEQFSQTRNPYQLDGWVMRDDEQTKIHVTMFRDRSGEAVVEITRRSGCAFLFNRFFNEVVSKMEELGIAMRRSARATNTFNPAPEPMNDAFLPTAVAGDVVQLFCGSGTCGYVDCEKEAVKTLARLSGWRVNQNVFAQEIKHLVPVIKTALNSQDVESRRCGASLLFNLATMARVHPELAELLPLVFGTIRDCPRKEIRRQLLACVELMTNSNDVRSVMQAEPEYHRIVAYLPDEACFRNVKEAVLKAIRPVAAH